MGGGILKLIGCCCAALMLEMRFAPPDCINADGMLEVLENLRKSLNSSFFQTSILMFMMIYIESKITKIKITKIGYLICLCFVLSTIWLCGENFRIDNTLNNIFCSSGQIVKSVIYMQGGMWFLFNAGKLIWAVSEQSVSGNIKTIYVNSKNRYLFWVLLIVAFWVPGIIISYPATACYDAWKELAEYFGYSSFTSHHPPFFTILIGNIVTLGKTIGNTNVGLFLISVFQSTVGVFVTAYMLFTMRKVKVQNWLENVSILFLILCPYFNAYNVTIIKDTLYSYGFLLFMIEIFYLVYYDKNTIEIKKHSILLSISIIIMMLTRHNGKFVVYITFFAFGIWWIRKYKNSLKKDCVYLISWFVPILIAMVISCVIIRVYHVEEVQGENIKESFSALFQQTARDVKENEADITENERYIIDKILIYDELAERYDPKISDPVKATFRYEVTNAEVKEYIRVWGARLLKHPLTYIQATMNQNYYLLYPFTENIVIYDTIYVEAFKDVIDDLGASNNMTFEELNGIRASAYRLLHVLPITGLMSCIAFYNIIMLFILLFAACNKEWDMFMIAVPILISDIIVLASPVVSPRYTFPVIYAMPILITYYLKINSSGKI